MAGEGEVARHVAIIMDGNGRWAKARHLPRVVGHQRGVEAVRKLVRALKDMPIECLTLYAFSSENWKRPEDEVDDLMNMMRKFIKTDLPEFIANDVRLHILGDWRGLAPDIVALLEDALAQTAHGKRTLAVALNYGSQHEIARAATKAAAEGAITAESIERHLDTAPLPPLDLLIRTSGDSSRLTPDICVACSHTLGGSAARWLSKRSQIIVVLLEASACAGRVNRR